jgi:hypothetical protein
MGLVSILYLVSIWEVDLRVYLKKISTVLFALFLSFFLPTYYGETHFDSPGRFSQRYSRSARNLRVMRRADVRLILLLYTAHSPRHEM